MIPTKERIEGLLTTNPHWWNAPEHMNVPKIIIQRKILKDLIALHEKDQELYSEVMVILAREIATKDWTASCGTFPIWNAMFSKAKGVAKKKLTGKSPLEQLSKGLLRHGTKEKLTEFYQ